MAATSTPWGLSQSEHERIPGVIFYSTASHGGVRLSIARQAEFRRVFPDWSGWIGGCEWFEEDCDAVLPALAFASEYDDRAIFYAVRSVKGSPDYFRAILPWFETEAGRATVARADSYAASVADQWEVGSMSTLLPGDYGLTRDEARGLWNVHLFRSDGAAGWFLMPYPEREFYTDAEVSRFRKAA